MTTQDTPTLDQQCADFEAWRTAEYTSHIPKSGNGYSNLDTELAWCAWKAAVALYRQQRGEPVGYIAAGLLNQYLEKCREPGVDLHIENLPVASRPPNECTTGAVPIFLSPQPAAPVVKESLTVAEPVKVPSDEEILTCIRAGFEEAGRESIMGENLIEVLSNSAWLIQARALLARYGSKS